MTNIKDDLKKRKPLVGTDAVIRAILKHKTSKVYVSSNCPQKGKILSLAKTHNIEAEQLKENNKEVGVLCKRWYPISTVSFE
ncbi:MAG: hypothetical protein AABX19_03655 [Nanoarchaeota archaeon]